MRSDVQHGDIAFSLLNLTDIRIGSGLSGRQCLVGQALLLSAVADGRSKELEQCVTSDCLVKRRTACLALLLPSDHPWRGSGSSVRGEGEDIVRVQGVRQARRTGILKARARRSSVSTVILRFPSFDLADIRGPYARGGSECWLGQSSLLPALTKDGPKALQRGVVWMWRAR